MKYIFRKNNININWFVLYLGKNSLAIIYKMSRLVKYLTIPLGKSSKLRLRKFLKRLNGLADNTSETKLNNFIGGRYTNKPFVELYNSSVDKYNDNINAARNIKQKENNKKNNEKAKQKRKEKKYIKEFPLYEIELPDDFKYLIKFPKNLATWIIEYDFSEEIE